MKYSRAIVIYEYMLSFESSGICDGRRRIQEPYVFYPFSLAIPPRVRVLTKRAYDFSERSCTRFSSRAHVTRRGDGRKKNPKLEKTTAAEEKKRSRRTRGSRRRSATPTDRPRHCVYGDGGRRPLSGGRFTQPLYYTLYTPPTVIPRPYYL